MFSGVTDLQGEVILQRVDVQNSYSNTSAIVGPEDRTAIVEGLERLTEYYVTVTLKMWGGESVSSIPVAITTKEGGEICCQNEVLSNEFCLCFHR